MNTKTAYFNRFIIEMPEQAVRDCSHQGACDEDVAYWADKLKIDVAPEAIRQELKEYGAWNEEELSNEQDNLERIIWIAAGDIQEEEWWAAREKEDEGEAQ